MDIISPERRSALMSRIRGKDTGIELTVRKGLHRLGLRYRLGGAGLPGRPDIVLPKYRAVVFVHGCFWHGHVCPLFRLPKTRTAFWQAKIDANRKRDSRNAEELRRVGWNVHTIRECQIRNLTTSEVERVVRSLAVNIERQEHSMEEGTNGSDRPERETRLEPAEGIDGFEHQALRQEAVEE
jgi:DNA mismatch endonuclease (patch repair protein)